MVTSKAIMEIIKKIIDSKYKALTISMVGRDAFSREELKEMEKQGIDTSNKTSLMELVYYHNFINKHGTQGPNSVEDMENQQSNEQVKPQGDAHVYGVDHANEALKNSIEKLQQDVVSRLVSLIQENNQNYKYNALQNLERTEEVDTLVKESTLSKLKQKLRDTSGDVNRDWLRVATTVMSDTIGNGSVDRIVTENRDRDAGEVYVYRIVVQDAALCKYCRRFYLDEDGSPKVYKLSTILGNGTNYGKKKDSWLPVVGATHPNERCSQVIELKKGWKVLPGGRQTYIGSEKWDDYIVNKVVK
jgi:hypothetical protein